MKIDATQILALGAVGIAAFWVWRGVAAGQKVAAAVNPLNPDNAIASGVNRTLEAVGVIDKGSSLGSWLFDVFHEEYDPNRETKEAGFKGA